MEEFYVTWFGLIKTLSLTVGRFRHQFGVINRWHEHDLDQVFYPMAMTQVLGEGGLCQTGISLKWFMPPFIAHANELTVEVTNAENETLFAGTFFSVPSALLHLKSYYDLTEDTYLEWGLSGMYGLNNRRGYAADQSLPLQSESWRSTWVGGLDLTLHWSPLRQAKYRSVTWRSEGYYVNLELPTTTGGKRTQHSWGAYSYVDVQLATRWFVGVRGDIALPTIRENDDYAWSVAPYVTFWQSEFVYLRLQYLYGNKIPYENHAGSLARRTDHRVLLQIDFAAGPHKHEKY